MSETNNNDSYKVAQDEIQGEMVLGLDSTDSRGSGQGKPPLRAPVSSGGGAASAGGANISEEKERKLAEARALAALKLQRKQRLALLVHKRKNNLTYLQKVVANLHESFWLNSVQFSKENLSAYVSSVPKNRAEAFFFLGLSVSRLLALPAGLMTARACAQLLEEWEYYLAGTAMQGVKYFTARPANCVYPASPALENLSDISKPTLYRFANTVVYEYLQTPHISFTLDYPEVVLSLCETLAKLYVRLGQHEDSYNHATVYETIMRFDTRMKHHVINLIAKELTELAGNLVRQQTSSLRNLMAF